MRFSAAIERIIDYTTGNITVPLGGKSNLLYIHIPMSGCSVTMNRRKFLTKSAVAGMGLAAGCTGSLPGGSSNYPSRTVTWWIPYSKGGGQDLGQRTLAPYLEDTLGESLALKNVTGGGGGKAYQQLANDVEPNGYTISGTLLEFQYLMDAVFGFKYDPLDFQYIYQWARYPFVIAVRADSEWQTLTDVIEASKEKKLKWGQVAFGGPEHLAGLRLEDQTDFNGRPISFSGGGETMSALLGERVDLTFPTLAAATPRVKSGDIRLITMFSQPRSEFPALKGVFPDVPTITETDPITDPINAFATRGSIAPPELPDDKQKVLVEAHKEATAKEEWQKKARNQGELVVRAGPEGIKGNMEAIIEEYKPYIDRLKKSVKKIQEN